MIADALAAVFQILTPPFRAVLAKVLALTILLLGIAVVAFYKVLVAVVVLPYAWLDTTISVLAGLGLVVGSIFLVSPVSLLVAGFFVDDLAERVEREADPDVPPGRPMPVLRALVLSARFSALSLAVTLLALALLLVPGVNAIAFLGANAYLQGRQYFEFVALRHLPVAEVTALRRRHAGRLLGAGLVIALFVSVPVLYLATPLFGTAFMVRIFKRLVRREWAPAGA